MKSVKLVFVALLLSGLTGCVSNNKNIPDVGEPPLQQNYRANADTTSSTMMSPVTGAVNAYAGSMGR